MSQKKGRAGAPRVTRKIRLRKEEALALHRMGQGGGIEAVKQHLRFLRPRLDEVAVQEVAWRCEDPGSRGGIETGTDDDGDYADVAVTG